MLEDHREVQIDECETDSDDDESDFEEYHVQSLPTEHGLHDPAGLFVHFCISIYTVRDTYTCKIIKDPSNGSD